MTNLHLIRRRKFNLMKLEEKYLCVCKYLNSKYNFNNSFIFDVYLFLK